LLSQKQPLLFVERSERPLGFALTLGGTLQTFLDPPHSQWKIL